MKPIITSAKRNKPLGNAVLREDRHQGNLPNKKTKKQKTGLV